MRKLRQREREGEGGETGRQRDRDINKEREREKERDRLLANAQLGQMSKVIQLSTSCSPLVKHRFRGLPSNKRGEFCGL